MPTKKGIGGWESEDDPDLEKSPNSHLKSTDVVAKNFFFTAGMTQLDLDILRLADVFPYSITIEKLLQNILQIRSSGLFESKQRCRI